MLACLAHRHPPLSPWSPCHHASGAAKPRRDRGGESSQGEAGVCVVVPPTTVAANSAPPTWDARRGQTASYRPIVSRSVSLGPQFCMQARRASGREACTEYFVVPMPAVECINLGGKYATRSCITEVCVMLLRISLLASLAWLGLVGGGGRASVPGPGHHGHTHPRPSRNTHRRVYA